MTKSIPEVKYQARIKVGEEVLFENSGNDLNALIAIVNARLERENTGAVGEIVDLKACEVVYNAVKQAANE